MGDCIEVRYSNQYHQGSWHMELSELFDDFEQSLRRRELSPCTIDAYRWGLHDLIFKAMAPAHLTDVSHLTRVVLEKWQDSQLERGWVPRTRGVAPTAIRQFIRYRLHHELISTLNPHPPPPHVNQPNP